MSASRGGSPATSASAAATPAGERISVSEVSAGAAYEKYDYTDVQMDDYIYAIRTGTNQSYLSGAYAFPNYKASIVYVTVAYRF